MSKMSELDLKRTRIKVTIGGGGGGRGGAVSKISPINNGKSVNLRLSDKAVAELRQQNATHVQCEWEAHGEKIELLVVTPSPSGLRIRYDNGGLRPHIHVPTQDVGKVTTLSTGTYECPSESIDGNQFKFGVPDGIRFESSNPTKAK